MKYSKEELKEFMLKEVDIIFMVKGWTITLADPSGQFKGNEYLQIYKHLEITFDGKPYVVNAGFEKTGERMLVESVMERYGGVSLRDYLLKKMRGW